MTYREERRRRDEAQFIAATCRTMAAFAWRAGFPTAAYLMGVAELDIAQSAMLTEHLKMMESHSGSIDPFKR
jgi:hypothetical protein